MRKRDIDIFIKARDETKKAFGSVGSGVEGLKTQFRSLRTVALGALGGIAGGFALRDVIEAYGEQESATRGLADAMKLAGGYSAAAMKDFGKFAAGVQGMTTIGDEAVMQLAEQNGWTVRDFEIDDGCYEIEGRDQDGREIEVKLDPATLQIVEMDYEDEDDDRGGARNPAPAGTVAPPQNGLFGNGTPPQVQVN